MPKDTREYGQIRNNHNPPRAFEITVYFYVMRPTYPIHQVALADFFEKACNINSKEYKITIPKDIGGIAIICISTE